MYVKTQASNQAGISMKQQSRVARLEEALGKMDWGSIEAAIETATELRDELQSWLDNMPENLQNSSKADEVQESIDALDEKISNLEDIVNNIQEEANSDINFPGAR